MNHAINHALDDLPLDAFDIDDGDVQAETLTTGHGMTETAGSCSFRCSCCC